MSTCFHDIQEVHFPQPPQRRNVQCHTLFSSSYAYCHVQSAARASYQKSSFYDTVFTHYLVVKNICTNNAIRNCFNKIKWLSISTHAFAQKCKTFRQLAGMLASTSMPFHRHDSLHLFTGIVFRHQVDRKLHFAFPALTCHDCTRFSGFTPDFLVTRTGACPIGDLVLEIATPDEARKICNSRRTSTLRFDF